jgi:hypothetical protein
MTDTHADKGENQPVEPGEEVVGHKTFSDGHGGFRHDPLTRAEADSLMVAADAARADRAARFPTAEDAVRVLWDAWYRLQELGWKDAQYAPADRRLRRVVELGSTGIHEGYCEPRSDRPLEKWWWIPSEGDVWPSRPILYAPDDEERAEQEARFAAARAAIEREQQP